MDTQGSGAKVSLFGLIQIAEDGNAGFIIKVSQHSASQVALYGAAEL